MPRAHTRAALVGSTTAQFLEAKIELAITFARLVRTERAFGQTAVAENLAYKAAQALTEADAHVRDLERQGFRVQILRARLGRLRAELAGVDCGQRKAA